MAISFLCRIGLHDLTRQSGFAVFYFCSRPGCTKGWPQIWIDEQAERIERIERLRRDKSGTQ